MGFFFCQYVGLLHIVNPIKFWTSAKPSHAIWVFWGLGFLWNKNWSENASIKKKKWTKHAEESGIEMSKWSDGSVNICQKQRHQVSFFFPNRHKPLKHHVFSVGGLWNTFMVMVTVTTVLKVLSVFLAELISSITDWFQTKPTWAKLDVLEDTELKTTGGSESETRQNY